MRFILLLSVIFFSFQLHSQSPNWEWSRSAKYDSLSYDGLKDMCADKSGNCFLFGEFGYRIIFDSDTLNSTGNENLFLAKYDNSGNVLWTKNIGRCSTALQDFSETADDSGNVLISGTYQDTLRFDSINIVSVYPCIFLAKYDNSGNFQWLKKFGGNESSFVTALTTDLNNNIYLSGGYDYSIAPGGCCDSASINIDTITLIDIPDAYDFFTAKLNSTGSVLWAKSGHFGSVNSMSADGFGSIYLCGNFEAYSGIPYLAFGGDTLYAYNDENSFLIKCDDFGNLKWIKGVTTPFQWKPADDRALYVKANQLGKIYLTGIFSNDSIKFDNYTLYPNGFSNVYLVQYDSSGTVDWATSSNVGWAKSSYLFIDNCGNINMACEVEDYPFGFDSISFSSGTNPMENYVLIQFTNNGHAVAGINLIGGGANFIYLATDSESNLYNAGNLSYAPVIIGNDTLYGSTYVNVPFLSKLTLNCSAVLPSVNGFNEVKKTTSIKVYPDPFSDKITILLNENTQSEITLFDLMSRKVLHQYFNNSITLNTENLSNGIYIYEIKTNDGNYQTGKIIKN